jgi:ribose-phosphate pyrophosphokinase
VVIVDDMIDTGKTLKVLSERLKAAGANNIYVCAAHGLFSEHAAEMISNSPLTKVIVTDSLPLHHTANDKIEQVSIAKYLADVIATEHLQHYHPNKKEEEEKFDQDD